MAGNKTYEYVLSLKDRMSKTMQKVSQKGGKAYARLHKMQSKMNKLTNKFIPISNKAIAGIGVAAVGLLTTKMVQLTTKTANALDELAKMGEQTGLGATKLKAYQFAAERSGVATTTFNSGMETLNKRVGELRAGTGALTTKLNAMGKQGLAKQLKRAGSTEEAFQIMTGAINNASDGIEKNTLATAAFSKGGIKMVRMMSSGNEEMQKLVKYSIQTTGNLDKAAKSAEGYQDAQTNMNLAIFGMKTVITTQLMPIIMKYIKQLTGWIRKNKELIAGKIKTFIQGVAKAVKWLVDNMNWLKPVIGGIITALVALKVATIAVNVAMMANPIGLIIAGVAALIAGIVLLVRNWDKVTDAIKRFGDWVIRIFTGVFKWIQALREKIGLFFKFLWYKVTGQDQKAQEARMKMKGIKLGQSFQKGFQKGQKKEQKLQTYGVKSIRENIMNMDAGGGEGAGGEPVVTPGGSGASAEGIATSGRKQTNINITLGNLVENMNISGDGIDETIDNMEEKVTSALLRALNSANLTANG